MATIKADVTTEHTVSFSTKELVKMISLVYPEIFTGNEQATGKLIVQTHGHGDPNCEVQHIFDEDATIELKIKQYPI